MRSPRREVAGTALGLAGSLVIHGLTFLIVSSVSTAPQLEFEFELPAEVEFGLTEEMEAAQGNSGGSPPSDAPSALAAGGDGAGGPQAERDAGIDAGRDAGIDAGSDGGIDAGSDAGSDGGIDAGSDGGIDAETGPERGPDDPEETSDHEGTADGSENLAGPARIPPGAQIALRLDLSAVRQSPLAPEVRRLLAAIPDWELILAGSGIDPLDDLDRLLIASPNLQRARLVIAGRHTHADETGDGRDYIRDVVQRFGATRGQPTPWSRRHGVEVAPWPNEDETPRVLAIVGPRHFTITRPEDLQRTLSIARAREERAEEEDGAPTGAGPDALLSMGPGDVFTIEVEGARRFLRRGDTERIPTRLRLAVGPGDGSTLRVRGVATYDSPAQAETAFAFWDGERQRAARNTMVRLMGLASALADGTLTLDGASIRIDAPLTEAQARLLLGYAEGMVRRPRRRAGPVRPRDPAPAPTPEGPAP